MRDFVASFSVKVDKISNKATGDMFVRLQIISADGMLQLAAALPPDVADAISQALKVTAEDARKSIIHPGIATPPQN